MLVENAQNDGERTLSTQPGSMVEQVADLESLRIVLSGESPVDLNRAWFVDRTAVDRFLRLHQFDTDNPLDMERLTRLHNDAVVYLTDTHHYRLPHDVEQPQDIHALFVASAQAPSREQRYSCMALKVMHVMHHMHCREIIYGNAIAEADLFARLNNRVFQTVDTMRAAGIVVDSFSTGKKSHSSLVTKLLAKRGLLATHIFDKLRFRIVLKDRDELVLALIYLLKHLIPYNYVVPDESSNSLIGLRDLVRVLNLSEAFVGEHGAPRCLKDCLTPDKPTPPNEFSGSTFRCVNFVADIPVRIDDVVTSETPAIAVVQAEIQLVDRITHGQNNEGDNAHELYKNRQRDHVRRRLEGGWREWD